MKYSLSLLVLLSAIAFAGAAAPARAQENAAQSQQEKEAFARDFAQQVLAIIQDPKKSFAGRKDVLRQAFSNSVDIDWIARFVLGKAWNGATAEQRARYVSLYRTYLTETYVANFAENPDKRIRDIKIDGVSEKDAEDFTVRTQMQLADAEDLKVSYLVRDEDGHYKVLDIAIENVSLIATHRSEFSRLASARGVDGVIDALQRRIGASPSMTLSMN